MRKLAEVIVGSKPSVDLVLGTLSFKFSGLLLGRYGKNRGTGIRPSGASSILVPTSEWTKKEDFNYPGRPQLASDFLSLSPLQFSTTLQLHKKLSALKPKGKRRGEDDSAANKPYLGNIGYSGQYRSAFEHNRYPIVLLFFACRDYVKLSRSDCYFMLPNPPPTSGGSVSAGPLRGPRHKPFRSSSMSGLTRKV